MPVVPALACAGCVPTTPLDLGGLEIPLAVGMLLGGTVTFVSFVTLLVRVVGRLWPPDRGDRDVRPQRQSEPGPSRPGDSRTRRRAVTMPRVVVAATMAAGLLFALAWAAFVLGRGTSLS